MAVIRKIDKIDEAHPYYLRSLFVVNTGLYTQAAFDAVTYLIDTFGVEFHETFVNGFRGCGYMKVYREFDGEVCFDVRGTTAESFIVEWKRVMEDGLRIFVPAEEKLAEDANCIKDELFKEEHSERWRTLVGKPWSQLKSEAVITMQNDIRNEAEKMRHLLLDLSSRREVSFQEAGKKIDSKIKNLSRFIAKDER